MTGAGQDEIVIPWLADEDARAEHVRSVRSGVSHRRALFPRAPRPGAPVVVELTAGPACLARDAWVEAGGERRPLELVGSEWDTLLSGYVRRYRGQLPGQPHGSVVAYRLGVGGDEADGGMGHAYAVLDPGAVAWAADAIVYQVWVDRFSSTGGMQWPSGGSLPADRYGGTLRGLRERLDYIVELGANTIWLNPIHPSGSYHGYDVTDYFAVDPAHRHPRRLRRDSSARHPRAAGYDSCSISCASHVSNAAPDLSVAAQAERDKPTRRRGIRFDRSGQVPTDSFFGVETMPLAATTTHARGARAPRSRRRRFWVERGVDGLRLDYALGPSPQFWAELRVAVKSRFPDCWLFGEVVETPETPSSSSKACCDGCLDFASWSQALAQRPSRYRDSNEHARIRRPSSRRTRQFIPGGVVAARRSSTIMISNRFLFAAGVAIASG